MIDITKMKLEDLTRRNVRYVCFRLQTEAVGGSKAKKEKDGIMQLVDSLKKHIEEQDDFGGWDKFAKTWDVDEKSPLVVIKRTSSIQTEWNKILKEETKPIPEGTTVTDSKEVKKIVTVASSPAPTPTPLRDARGKFISTSRSSTVSSEEDSEKKSFWDVLK